LNFLVSSRMFTMFQIHKVLNDSLYPTMFVPDSIPTQSINTVRVMVRDCC
jgi:hypothetical protein